MMLRTFIVVFLAALTGCALKHGPLPTTGLTPIGDHLEYRENRVAAKTVNIIGYEICAGPFETAVEYLRSEGIFVRRDSNAKQTIVCLPPTPIWVTLIDPLRFVPGGAVAPGITGWVNFVGFSVFDSKWMLHELMHLLFDIKHRPSGVMFPLADLLFLATGLDEETLHAVREQQLKEEIAQ